MKRIRYMTLGGLFLMLVFFIGAFVFKNDKTIVGEIQNLRLTLIGLTGFVLFGVGKHLEKDS